MTLSQETLEEITKYTDGPRSSPEGQMLQGRISEEGLVADEALSAIDDILKDEK